MKPLFYSLPLTLALLAIPAPAQNLSDAQASLAVGQLSPNPALAASLAPNASSLNSDSILQITADARGLTPLINVPNTPCSTYWIFAGSVLAPYPVLPPPESLTFSAAYELAPHEFLIDATDGQVVTRRNISLTDALLNQANAIDALINQVQAAALTAVSAPVMQTKAMSMGAPSPGGSGGSVGGIVTPKNITYNTPYTTNDLWIEIKGKTNTTAGLVIHLPWNVTNSVYDLFATPTLAPRAWQWVLRSTSGQTNLIVPGLWSSNMFFLLASTQDSNGDGITDAYDQLVNRAGVDWRSTDGSGMSDNWQMFYFGHTGVNPNADPDGDGLTNYQEYMGGTNPNVKDNYQVMLAEPKPNANLP